MEHQGFVQRFGQGIQRFDGFPYGKRSQTNLIQKEGGIIKNATMFYLSDRCININEIHFIKNYHEIWNKCDVMVAANQRYLDWQNQKEDFGKIRTKIQHQRHCRFLDTKHQRNCFNINFTINLPLFYQITNKNQYVKRKSLIRDINQSHENLKKNKKNKFIFFVPNTEGIAMAAL